VCKSKVISAGVKSLYLHQVNEVNGGDNVFIWHCLSVCV